MIDDPTKTEMEKTARAAIVKAGEHIRRHFGAPGSVETKGQSDYITNVDRECQSVIIETMEKRFPDHHFISEEMDKHELREGITWFIDPLDGTTNFVHGFPMVAVSVAAYVGDEPILGLVFDPIRHELFAAQKRRGAQLNGKPISVNHATALQECIIATGFPFKAKELIEPYMTTFEYIFHRVSDIRRAGSAALDLAYLAAGRVGGFWEIGLQAWDVAAGALLIQEAGGLVSDFWGEPNFIRNGHIVAGTPNVYPFLIEAVRIDLAPVLED